jgi:DNA repair protein SbcD/Mre11
MAAGGVHLRAERPQLALMGAPLHWEIPGHAPLQVLPLPYIDPYRITDLADVAPQHGATLQAVLNLRAAEIHDPQRTIVMAHAFVAGGTASDSERELSVGGTSAVPSEVFSHFGYTALGHLHRPQQVGSDTVVYSGSPLAYSFSEEHDKSVRIIDVGSGITSQVIPVEVGRRVYTLTGTLEDLLTNSKHEHATSGFVRARLTDPSVQFGAMEKLRARYGQILELEQVALSAQSSLSGTATREMMTRSPGELLNGYLEHTFPDLDQDDQDLIHQSFNRVSAGAR